MNDRPHLRRSDSSGIPGMPANVGALSEVGRDRHPDRRAICESSGRVVTYRELDDLVARAAGSLRKRGVRPGDRVAASMGNTVTTVVAFLATMRIGAIWVGINRNLAPAEKQFLLDDAGVSVFLADCAFADVVHVADGGAPHTVATEAWEAELGEITAPVAASLSIDTAAPAVIAYTSGTTGRPKGAVHSQHNLLVFVAGYAASDLIGDHEVHGVLLPLTIANVMLLGALTVLHAGGTCVLIQTLAAPAVAADVARFSIERLFCVPTIVHDLTNSTAIPPTALASISSLGVGASSLPAGLRERFCAKFGKDFYFGYGLTEAPATVTAERVGEPTAVSSGYPLPHVQVEIRDAADRPCPNGAIGEICVRDRSDGPWTGVYRPFLGYWNDPDATDEALRNGILHTGDIGWLDDEGRLCVAGRRNDVIMRGGANIYPAEIERVLNDHHAVTTSAVIAVDDERLGQVPVAAVTVDGCDPTSEPELVAHCARLLARFKIPERIVIVDELPRNAMGKVSREGLLALISAAAPVSRNEA